MPGAQAVQFTRAHPATIAAQGRLSRFNDNIGSLSMAVLALASIGSYAVVLFLLPSRG